MNVFIDANAWLSSSLPRRMTWKNSASGASSSTGGRTVNGNAEGLRSLVKYAKLPIERVAYLPDADERIVRSIERGILFLMAFWSGPSVMAFAKLTEVVARLDKVGALELVVVDVDGSPKLAEMPEFVGKVRGAGETAWVREGKIVATSGRGLNTACFESNTIALLSMP
jgi:hypothetical protein